MRHKLLNVLMVGATAALSATLSAETLTPAEFNRSRSKLTAAISDSKSPRDNTEAWTIDDWPCWRGPAGDNRSLGPQTPIEWNETKNVIWRADVPGRGHGSPCLIRDRIFLPSADDISGEQFLLCYDRKRGTLLWRVELHRGTLPKIHEKNSHASATPASDADVVFMTLLNSDQLWLSAVTIEGQILWQKKIGDYLHATGYGSSPVLFRNLVIVANDNRLDPAIVALDGANGELVWRVERPKTDNSATPIVANIAGRHQLLLNGAFAVVSYDPATGEELWRVKHATEVAACTIAFDDDCVYASGGYPEKTMMCVRADGTGDVTDTHVLWKTNHSNTYVPSPLVDGDLLYVVADSGIVFCRNAQSGVVVWKHRLHGSFFASPIAAGGQIHATNDAGVTYVFRASSEYNLLAKNDVGEDCMATPAICRGQIYLRTASHLYCIGKAGDDENRQARADE
jgi:outer membrane protein assembly factor BamB